MRNYIIVFVFCFLYNFSFSQSGSLDPTFDFDGKLVTTFSDEAKAHAVDVQQDGKIVAGGYLGPYTHRDFVVCRYNIDGSLDASFGTLGIAVVDINPLQDDIIRDLKIQEDGKIVVVGEGGNTATPHIVAARFNSDGTLDSGFGSNGLLNLTSLYDSYANSVNIDSLNRIFIGGCNTATGFYRPAVLCFNSSGIPDSSFGVNGRMTDYALIGTVAEIIPAITGLITCVTTSSFVLAKYNYAGVRDSSFGTNGCVMNDFNSNNWATSNKCALQADGKIVVAGSVDYTQLGIGEDFLVARFTSNGVLDNTFGTNGYVVYSVSARDILWGVHVLPNGKIITGGQVNYPGSTGYDFALLKLNPDGTRDGSFGVSGLVTTDFGSNADIAFDMVVQSNSAIILCGQNYSGNQAGFSLARYVDATTDLSENNNKQDFMIYPVPVVDGRIHFNTLLNDAAINIYDAAGRTVYHAVAFTGTAINVNPALSKGVYTIQVISEKTVKTLKFEVAEQR